MVGIIGLSGSGKLIFVLMFNGVIFYFIRGDFFGEVLVRNFLIGEELRILEILVFKFFIVVGFVF